MYTNTNMKQMKPSLHQQVYQTALRNKFITSSEAKDIVGNANTARIILSRLFGRGQLLRVRGGLYAAIPPERVGMEYEVDRYPLIDKALGAKGALAFHSALELHGVAQSSFTTVFYLSEKSVRPFEFQEILFKVIRTERLFGTMPLFRNEVQLNVTDKERTFLDCIRRPDLCGGLEEYLKSFEGFVQLSPARLLDYLERFGDLSLYQRAGFVLTLLRNELKVPEDLLEVLRSRVGKVRFPLVPGSRKDDSRLDAEWKVLVPKNLEEMTRFV